MAVNKISYDTLKKFIIKNLIYIAVMMLCIIYIVSGFIMVTDSGRSIVQIIGDSIIVFLFSYFIVQAFMLQGVIKGDQSVEVTSARKEHGEVKKEIGTSLAGLYNYLTIKNKQIEKEQKNELLYDFGLTLDMVEQGFDKSKFTKKELKKIYDIKNKKYKKIMVKDVVNENGKPDDVLLGRTKIGFMTKRNLSTITTKIIYTLMFGYFSTSFIGFDISQFLWKLLQVTLFLIFGIMEYYHSYMFMTGEYYESLLKKTLILKEYHNFLGEKKC